MTLTRQKAITCLVVNQLACPGIGSLMAGKRVGYVQAAVMIAGAALVLAWSLMAVNAGYKFALDPLMSEAQFRAMQPPLWMALAGFGLCAIAWFWALWVSMRLLHESRSHQPV